MPGIRRRKLWHEMTQREIVSTLIACTVIGGVIESVAIYMIAELPEWHPFLLLWPGAGMLFVASCLAVGYMQALQELRRRRPND